MPRAGLQAFFRGNGSASLPAVAPAAPEREWGGVGGLAPRMHPHPRGSLDPLRPEPPPHPDLHHLRRTRRPGWDPSLFTFLGTLRSCLSGFKVNDTDSKRAFIPMAGRCPAREPPRAGQSRAVIPPAPCSVLGQIPQRHGEGFRSDFVPPSGCRQSSG